MTCLIPTRRSEFSSLLLAYLLPLLCAISTESEPFKISSQQFPTRSKRGKQKHDTRPLFTVGIKRKVVILLLECALCHFQLLVSITLVELDAKSTNSATIAFGYYGEILPHISLSLKYLIMLRK